MSTQNKERIGLKTALCLFLACAAVLCVGLLFAPKDARVSARLSWRDITTNEDRLTLIRSFGWETEEAPCEIAEVSIPHTFNETYERYNDLQKPLGLDLYRHRGKSARRYTYVVTNYEWDGTVYLNLLLSGSGELLGGDVCSAKEDGFLLSLKRST